VEKRKRMVRDLAAFSMKDDKSLPCMMYLPMSSLARDGRGIGVGPFGWIVVGALDGTAPFFELPFFPDFLPDLLFFDVFDEVPLPDFLPLFEETEESLRPSVREDTA
jgi:hypothetical protein